MSSEYTTNTTLMILIDAFPKTYMTENFTPFIYATARNGFSTSIEPLFAFEGIEATIFTGKWPIVHNIWTEFRYTHNPNYLKNVMRAGTTKTLDLLPDDGLKSKLRFAVDRYLFKSFYKTPNLIPALATPYFEPSISRGIAENNVLGGISTVFDLFRRAGIRFIFIEPWISGDKGVANRVKRLATRNQKFHFWYVKLNCLDHCGHRFGPVPLMFQNQLMEIDAYVEQIVTLLRKQNPKLNVMILTDHGMSKVNRKVNILEGLGQLKSKIYQDYVLFIDSTMARFWFFKERAEKEVCYFLSQKKCGHILNSKEKVLLRIPSDPSYGKVIYVLDEGFIFHPCFFHSKSMLRGMHGYAYPRTSEAAPMLIMNKEMAQTSKQEGCISYGDMFPLLLNSLRITSSDNVSMQRAEGELQT